MKNEELLVKFAEKLGTTVEHLWGVLIAQAPIKATVNTLWFAVAYGALALLWRATSRLDEHDEPRFVSRMAVIGGAALVTLILATEASNIVSAFVNPEFWALETAGRILK